MTDRKGVFLKPKEGRSYPMGAMSQPASHHLFVDELKLDSNGPVQQRLYVMPRETLPNTRFEVTAEDSLAALGSSVRSLRSGLRFARCARRHLNRNVRPPWSRCGRYAMAGRVYGGARQ